MHRSGEAGGNDGGNPAQPTSQEQLVQYVVQGIQPQQTLAVTVAPAQQQQQQQAVMQQLQTGMLVVPQTSPARAGQLIIQQQQATGSTGQASAVSATGGTIHHLGHSPSRGTLSVTSANPGQHLQVSSIMSAEQQQQLQGLVTQLAQSPAVTTQTPQTMSVPATPTKASSMIRSPLQSPERPKKRIKLEEKPPATAEISQYRKLICDKKFEEMLKVKENYNEHLTELFYLQSGWNFMDYFQWKKRPTLQLMQVLKSGCLDSDDEDGATEKSINNEVKVLTTSGSSTPLATPVAISTSLPPAVAAINQHGLTDQFRKGGRHGMVYGHLPLPSKAATVVSATATPMPYSRAGTNGTASSSGVDQKPVLPSISQSSTLAEMMAAGDAKPATTSEDVKPTISSLLSSSSAPKQKSPQSAVKATARPTIASVYENTCGSQEAIVERAKQEAKVMQKVAELRKEGLWSARRLPKVQEPARNKAHWDYLLEEMQWLAADFAQERKWKKAGCRKIARMVSRYHQEKHQRELKAEKEEHTKVRKIASNMAKMVKEFWSNIEKVVEYKQSSRLEEKRKKALDLHLSFIVDQTEKYSSWLTEGITGAPSTSSVGTPSISGNEDGDFEPESESDDESTIAVADKEAGDVKDELAALEKEGDMPIEELLKTLPKEVLDKPADVASQSSSKKSKKTEDEEFNSDMEDSDDDEETLEKEEKLEGDKSHKAELDELEAEGQMSIEELAKKYSGAYDSDFEVPEDESEDETSTEEESEEEEEEEESDGEEGDDEEETEEQQKEVGMEYLFTDLDKEEPEAIKPADKPTDAAAATPAAPTDAAKKEAAPATTPVAKAGGVDATKAEGPAQITDFAAAAQSIQPTGYTLQTTSVKTPIPFLLKHTMREYQVVGLDWLATMYERRLNGILADEMGLGKTIQTISLLAHLACEHGVWGPHLIVVPTSVMLNWEMEFKKWCPAFKILTYYGNQKERKQKRTGWTKTNAFHVCITSYKLVIQDHQAFRRKKWKYFILDEAQNIKNFKSQRWQTLLNFSSQRRLLLTGTPLQNSLMELWSLMHFLMPHVFQSHKEFKEWFSNPLTGMIEGSHEYNENLIKRLHKVLRPFLLRRLKADVEKQMPKKYEKLVMCRLSKRQRFLYDDFMAQTKTKETLASGHFMSVINILMQLRKVCNHPNLFDPRPIQSPFQMEGINLLTPSLVMKALKYEPLEDVNLGVLPGFTLAGLEKSNSAYASQCLEKLHTPKKLIEEIDSLPDPPRRVKAPRSQMRADEKSSVTTGVPQTVMSVETTPLQSLPGHNSSLLNHNAANGLSAAGLTLADLAEAAASTSPLYMPELQQRRIQQRKDKLHYLAEVNHRNCSVRPVYGTDLRENVNVIEETHDVNRSRWRGHGYVQCYKTKLSSKHPYHPEVFWTVTKGLNDMLRTPEDYTKELKDIITRFVFCVPPVVAPRIRMHASHPPPSWLNEQRMLQWTIHQELSPKATHLHPISSRTLVQFPEARLIQYDCGKLQTLDLLLRRLKSGQHRVLIFTQMTKMLDILESFLNFHGHRYLRLDGTTRVEQRQMLMDRFNQDKRIFVFILSTRSGGIGVNLTGADTVIFYDSDWNPTMDAQAQDRCHRIGQTRDVYIYRLISEMTIEENILKKANQKRMLGNMAIEGGNFTTDFFKEQSLTDLFKEPSGLEKFVKQKQAIEEKAAKLKEEKKEEKMTTEQLEQALQAAEDEADVQATKAVQAEQKAEVAEFDETIPWDETEAAQAAMREQEMSRVEQELMMLEKELTPIEKFAVGYLEEQLAPLNVEELEKAEEDVAIAKEEWELTRLQALRDEEERRLELEEDEMLYTYSRQAESQVFINDETGEHMPMWCPPTPPQDENDVYIDQSICFLYEPSTMGESQLPPVYVKREHKRIRVDPSLARHKHKVRKEEAPRVPRSLFDRPLGGLRRDLKIQKMRPGMNPGLHKSALKSQLPLNRQAMEHSVDSPDWLIHEDWALLQAVQVLLELPLNLATHSNAHIPNWDLVADVVNASSRIYRSPKQCKLRYEHVIVPREEGKILYDMNPRKPKKTKGIYKTKNNRPMRTSQLHLSDNNQAATTLHSLRFDATKAIAAKRTPTLRPTLANPTLKNPKHTAVLLESGINYEQPLAPVQVAQIRAERIAREKKANQASTTTESSSTSSTKASTATSSTTATAATPTAAVTAVSTVATTLGQQVALLQTGQAGQTTAAVVAASTAGLPKTSAAVAAVSLALSRSLGVTAAGSIVVNTAPSFATINKRVGQAVVSTGQTPVTANVPSTLAAALRTAVARGGTTTPTGMTVQEIAAVVNQQGQQLKTPTAATLTPGSGTQVITTTTLTPAQLVAAAQRATVTSLSGSRAGTVQQALSTAAAAAAAAGKTQTLTPQQLIIRQQQILKQQQQQQQLQRVRAQTQAASGQKVTTPLITSVTGAQVSTGTTRLQVPKPATVGTAAQKVGATTVTRQINEAEMALLIKQRQLQQQQQQQQKSGAAAGTSQQAAVQQVQVSGAQVTRLPSGQLVAGTTVQQVSGQPVAAATLVKAASSGTAAASLPSVTIPVTAVNQLGITVNVPQQKALGSVTSKTMTAQQVRQIQQFQLKQRTSAAAQLQKTNVATLTGQLQQVKAGGTPFIIPNQTTTPLPKVMVQQLQKIIQQQQQQQSTSTAQTASTAAVQPSIQQIITSAAAPASSAGVVLTTQLVTMTQSPTVVQSIAKLAAASPNVTVATAASTTVTATASAARSASSVQGAVSAVGQPSSVVTAQPTVTTISAASLTPSAVKHVQEVVAVSPQKSGTMQSAAASTVAQQLKTVSQTTGLRALQTPMVAATGQQVAGQTVTVAQLGTAGAVVPSASVQQAVQQVVQQAQAQAQQRQQQQQQQTAAAAATASSTPATPGTPPASSAAQSAAERNSPYAMRLRNQKS